MKAYTDIEQSKMLESILPIESSDMKYPYFGDGQYGTTALFGEPIEFSGGKDVPCWSLAALLNAMPESIDRYDLTIIHCSPIEWGCVYQDINGNIKYECYVDNQVDACVEMILKLKEKDLL